MTCPSKTVACTLILALMFSSIMMVNSAKVNAANGSGSATGKITIWCYYMPGRSVSIFDEAGECLDSFYVWNTAIGTGGPVSVNFSLLTAINDGKYYSVDRLYTIEVKEAYTKLVYTTYAHGGDEISIAYTDGYTTCSGNKPPKIVASEPTPTTVPSSTPTQLTPAPSSPPSSSAQSEDSFINDTLGVFEGFGWEKAVLAVMAVVIGVLSLGMVGLWRRTGKLMQNNRSA